MNVDMLSLLRAIMAASYASKPSAVVVRRIEPGGLRHRLGLAGVSKALREQFVHDQRGRVSRHG
jgi:hypothetical protein